MSVSWRGLKPSKLYGLGCHSFAALADPLLGNCKAAWLAPDDHRNRKWPGESGQNMPISLEMDRTELLSSTTCRTEILFFSLEVFPFVHLAESLSLG